MQYVKNCLPLIVILTIAFSKISAQTTGDSLAYYRSQIDTLDKQLIAILGKRMQVVEQVGYYKVQHQMPPLQQARFDAILQKNIMLGAAYNLSAGFITSIMNDIHKESLAKENAIQPAGPPKP